MAVKKMAKRKAPGPDGIPGSVVKLVAMEFGGLIAQLFTECLKQGYFPSQWKEASLVLLRKAGKPEDTPSVYRPICLLGEVGKLLERVIARRLTRHMAEHEEYSLFEEQYGFREFRSTIDAISSLRKWVENTIRRNGGVTLAVSLDVSNAFNSIPWGTIMDALRDKGTPSYLLRTLRAYFKDRYILYINRDGAEDRLMVNRGVPQGSVLGPHLWNIGYDAVLRASLPAGCQTIGYADDTLVLVGGDSWHDATRTANHAVACVTRAVRKAGLKVAPEKTEAAFYHDGTCGDPPETSHVVVERIRVPVSNTIKYLGLLIDSTWGFREHFSRLTPKLEKAAAALSRILPNIGGPRRGGPSYVRCGGAFDGAVRSPNMGTRDTNGQSD